MPHGVALQPPYKALSNSGIAYPARSTGIPLTDAGRDLPSEKTSVSPVSYATGLLVIDMLPGGGGLCLWSR